MSETVETVTPEAPAPEAIEQTPESPRDKLYAHMDKVWDKLHAEPEASEDEDPTEETAETKAESQPDRDEKGRFKAKEAENEQAEESVEEKTEAEAKKTEAPGSLPYAVKQVWDKIPEEARAALHESQNRMSSEMGAMRKRDQAIGPIFEQIQAAAKELPFLADMKPEQIGQEVFQLARWAQALGADPASGAQALLSMADRYGTREALQQAIGGQVPDQTAQTQHALRQMQLKIQSLENDLAAARQEPVQNDVTRFAQSKGEDWALVETSLPAHIEAARAEMPHANSTQLLEAAWERATWAHPQFRERLLAERANAAAAEAARAAEEARKADAQRAARLNVRPNGAGKDKPQTPREAMEEAWARLHS